MVEYLTPILAYLEYDHGLVVTKKDCEVRRQTHTTTTNHIFDIESLKDLDSYLLRKLNYYII